MAGIKKSMKIRNADIFKYDLFVNEYINNGFNAGLAYLKYHKCSKRASIQYGYQWLQNPYIHNKIQEYKDKLLSKYEVNREVLLMDLMTIKQEALESKKYSDAIKAIDLMTKMLGLQAPQKLEVESRVIQISFGNDNDIIMDVE